MRGRNRKGKEPASKGGRARFLAMEPLYFGLSLCLSISGSYWFNTKGPGVLHFAQVRGPLRTRHPRLDPYIRAMSRVASKSRPLPRWKISRIKSTPAEELGTVEAPDAETAIRVAIKEFEITDPQHQRRLAARRVG